MTISIAWTINYWSGCAKPKSPGQGTPGTGLFWDGPARGSEVVLLGLAPAAIIASLPQFTQFTQSYKELKTTDLLEAFIL